ncbi:hypothetical protein E4U42_000152 [Claviceps africana]|uniref:Peptidase A1 domain-containing protein n=1 Tax=Claviceps africana TaxID=83212 RepID=A0A8K0J103_9HYPO|nr:hypothetical protein E4U42_000152 [Claviceps africana]
MRPPWLLVLSSALLSVVFPAVADLQKRSFAIERVRNPNFTGRNGPQALVKTYRKFNMALPQGLAEALEARRKKDAMAAAEQRGHWASRYTDRREPADDVSTGLRLGNEKENGNGDRNRLGHRIGNGQGRQARRRTGRLLASQNGNGTTGKQVGSVPAVSDRNEVEFLSPVTIGGQTLYLDLDTGSSDLWVMTTQLDPATTANHHVYNASRSATFRPLSGAAFRISYGDGSGAQGTVGIDVVDVGGASFAHQAIELATAVSPQFLRDQGNDGILGLAFSHINSVRPRPQRTFLDNIHSQLAEPVFTADLRKGAPGTYTFGRIDPSRFRGPLAWIPVNTTGGFWQFASECFAVGRDGEAQTSTPGGQAIVDTGTTLLLADAKVVDAYYAKVPGAWQDVIAGGYTFPCNAALPDLALDVGGVYTATVSGSDINFATVGQGICFGGVQATAPGQRAIYGDIFLKSQYVVFNAGNNSLGMAPHA